MATAAAAAAVDLIVVRDERLCQRQIISCHVSELERDCSVDNTVRAGVRHVVHHLTTTTPLTTYLSQTAGRYGMKNYSSVLSNPRHVLYYLHLL